MANPDPEDLPRSPPDRSLSRAQPRRFNIFCNCRRSPVAPATLELKRPIAEITPTTQR